MAKDFFVTRQTISSWENEKTYPDITNLINLINLINLSDYYHISLDTLLKEDAGLRDYLEKKDVSKNLRKVRISLLGIDVILVSILLSSLLNWIQIDSIVMSLILIITSLTMVALNDINKFDKTYRLNLQQTWQKYLSGDYGLLYTSIIPILFVLLGIIVIWNQHSLTGLYPIIIGFFIFIVLIIRKFKKY
ncbi:hypothetical protein GCM10025884_10710 [Leuconostoc gelidum subsp. gelidum]|nr:hypothetical protein GCM10025884_10710 [Leuconostoc gelidum subsp. gelidum]